LIGVTTPSFWFRLVDRKALEYAAFRRLVPVKEPQTRP
jgi:hypothetical protein